MGTADLMAGVNPSCPEKETYKRSKHHTEDYDTQK